MARFQISADDHGKALSLRLGDELLVQLPENPTTGYRWQVNSSGDPSLTLDNDHFDPAEPVAAGTSGMRVLIFRATSAGRAQVRLELRRVWETSQPATQEFSVPVEVRPH